MEHKHTIDAQEALERSDVKKFTKELQFIAQRGTLEDKRIMWSYLKDVVHNEFLISKSNSVKSSRGMRWSQDSKDLASSQKLMAGKRYVHIITKINHFLTLLLFRAQAASTFAGQCWWTSKKHDYAASHGSSQPGLPR